MERRINRFIFRRWRVGIIIFSRCKLQRYYRGRTTVYIDSIKCYRLTVPTTTAVVLFIGLQTERRRR